MASQSVGQWVLSSPSAGGSPDPWERGKRCRKSSVAMVLKEAEGLSGTRAGLDVGRVRGG